MGPDGARWGPGLRKLTHCSLNFHGSSSDMHSCSPCPWKPPGQARFFFLLHRFAPCKISIFRCSKVDNDGTGEWWGCETLRWRWALGTLGLCFPTVSWGDLVSDLGHLKVCKKSKISCGDGGVGAWWHALEASPFFAKFEWTETGTWNLKRFFNSYRMMMCASRMNRYKDEILNMFKDFQRF